MEKNPYDVLGISKDASADEIKRAYRKLSKKYHPDLNHEAGAEEKFKEVNDAYEILSDPQKKAQFDQCILYTHRENPHSNGKNFLYMYSLVKL